MLRVYWDNRILSEDMKLLMCMWNWSALCNIIRFFLCFYSVCHHLLFLWENMHISQQILPVCFSSPSLIACCQLYTWSLSTLENWFRATENVLSGLADSSHWRSGGDQVCYFFSAFRSPTVSQATFPFFPCPAEINRVSLCILIIKYMIIYSDSAEKSKEERKGHP